jgi:acetyl-CoA acetyltransferase family protein
MKSSAKKFILQSRAFSTIKSPQKSNAVIVDGIRIPFMVSGTSYNDYMAVDLARFALQGLLTKTAISPKLVDYVVLGTVIQEVRTSNIAREAALQVGVPLKTPAHTVTMACISGNQAAFTACNLINTNQFDTIIVGGAETMSDVPIRFQREMRKRLLKSQKGIKTINDAMKFLKGFKLSYLIPEAPAIAEFSTNEVMGHSSDRLASKWNVSRLDQDKWSLRSHQLAHAATIGGLLQDEIFPVDGISTDNGIRADTTLEKLSSLKPAFVKPHGTHTAANSTFLTDGASAMLLMNHDKALALGFKPKVRIVDTIFVAQDPKEELLLGPAYSIVQLLQRNNLRSSDISVWEIHEAFAGQILANLNAMNSKAFYTNNLGLSSYENVFVGELPVDKINAWGGSLAIGHPFGATGTRLLTTAANRLVKGKNTGPGKFAVLSACAAGGQAVATLLELI